MRDPDFIRQLRYQLLKLGCPPGRMRKMVREMSDHREDLKQAASAEGLSEAEAELQVNARLGDPQILANQLVTVFRRSSWWGRHELFSFLLLPLLTVPILWAALLFLNLWFAFALGYGLNDKKLHAAADNPVAFHHMIIILQAADLVAITLATLLFCWLARRAGVRFLWLAVACAVCSLCGSFIWAHGAPHRVIVGLAVPGFHPQFIPWTRTAIPWLIAGLIYARQWRMTRVAELQITK